VKVSTVNKRSVGVQHMIARGSYPHTVSRFIGRTDNAMTKIALTKARASLLEYAVSIRARKKLIHAMSLDIDRSINRAVVVGCAISATRNYLNLHMSRTLKVLLCNTHAKRGSCGSVLPGCRPVDQFTSRPLLHFTRPPRCLLHSLRSVE